MITEGVMKLRTHLGFLVLVGLITLICSGCTTVSKTQVVAPDFSPSGVLHFSAIAKVPNGGEESGVFDVSVSTGAIVSKVLVDKIPKDFQRNLAVSRPAWSPDGRDVVFDIVDQEYGFALVRTDKDGSSFNEIARRKLADVADPRSLRYPAWSPDGSRIAFIEESLAEMSAALCSVDRDGGDFQRLSDLMFSHQSPPTMLTWSPDGRRFAIGYIKGIPTADPKELQIISEVRFISLDGEKIPTIQGHNPVWFPNGQRLAYVTDSPTTVQLLDLKTMSSKQLFKLDKGLQIKKMAGATNGTYLCYLVSEEPSEKEGTASTGQGAKASPTKQRLDIISVETGERRTVPAPIELYGASELFWTP